MAKSKTKRRKTHLGQIIRELANDWNLPVKDSVADINPKTKLAMARRRGKGKAGPKEWAERIVALLTDTERQELGAHLLITRNRIDVMWWVARLLNGAPNG